MSETPPPPSTEAPDPVDLVRRRLLLAGGRYVPPLVLATVMLGEARAQQASCMPAQVCMPFSMCPPSVGMTMM